MATTILAILVIYVITDAWVHRPLRLIKRWTRHEIFRSWIATLIILIIAHFGLGLGWSKIGVDQRFMGLVLSFFGINLVIITGRYIVAHKSPWNWFRRTRQGIIYKIAAEIPLQTSLLEEVLFRGAIFAALDSILTQNLAIAGSSIMFGLWHVPAAKNFQNQNKDIAPKSGPANIAINVLAPALAGVGFCWLRLVTGTLAAPFLAHWAINSIGVVLRYIWQKRQA